MKDFAQTNFNLENKLVQKGVLDLKAFWQYLEDRYFKVSENKNLDPFLSLFHLLSKHSEMEIYEKKEFKDPTKLTKLCEEISQESTKQGKIMKNDNYLFLFSIFTWLLDITCCFLFFILFIVINNYLLFY